MHESKETLNFEELDFLSRIVGRALEFAKMNLQKNDGLQNIISDFEGDIKKAQILLSKINMLKHKTKEKT